MVTGVEVVTALVLTVKFALVAPAATVTLAGTVAAEALLERETRAPLPGAGPLRVTVPVEGDPPVTLVGLSATEDSVGDPGGLPMSQEKAQSERARGPATASQVNNAANASHRRIGGAYRGKNIGGANACAIVVNVTVAVAAFFPSSVTGDGETEQVAWAGAPVQLQVTV